MATNGEMAIFPKATQASKIVPVRAGVSGKLREERLERNSKAPLTITFESGLSMSYPYHEVSAACDSNG